MWQTVPESSTCPPVLDHIPCSPFDWEEKLDQPHRAGRPNFLIWAMESICSANYVVCSHRAIVFPTHTMIQDIWSLTISDGTLPHLAVFHIAPPPSLLPSLIRLTRRHYWKYPRYTSKGGWRRRRGRGGGTINAWPDVCRSLACLSGICRLAAVAKEEDEEEWRWKSHQELIIRQDIGGTNDCCGCIWSPQKVAMWVARLSLASRIRCKF